MNHFNTGLATLQYMYREKLKNDIKDELKQEFRKEIMEELRRELRTELIEEMRKEKDKIKMEIQSEASLYYVDTLTKLPIIPEEKMNYEWITVPDK